MSGVVWSPISIPSDDLYVLTSEHRLYVGRSHDGTYLHVISPTQIDAIDIDGNVTRPAGSLACVCKGFLFHGTCYRLQAAEAFEASMAPEMPEWMRGEPAPETELERAAARG